MNQKVILSMGQLAELKAMRLTGKKWPAIKKHFEKLYRLELSEAGWKSLYRRNFSLAEVGSEVGDIKVLKEVARVKRTNSQVAKENRTILKALNSQEDFLESLRDCISNIPKAKVTKAKKPLKGAVNTCMTAELLLSDIHVGKKANGFSIDICKRRLQHLAKVFIDDIKRQQKSYNVERVIVNLMGDIVENSRMHGLESGMGCEENSPEQVRAAIDMLFVDVLRPISELGIPMDVMCITGNHDREAENKTYHYPGKNSLTWILYKTLEMLAESSGITHMKFEIPEGIYGMLDIYGTVYLIEHGDHIKGTTEKGFKDHLAARSHQEGIMLDGLRLGHWHTATSWGAGSIMINGSVCGGDSYTDVKGYSSVACQIINYYVKTTKRKNPFYHSLIVQLEDIR